MTRSRRQRRKALGQHWLVDRRYLSRIARAADCGPEDTVVEVGAGGGLLTELLAQKATRLIAVEVDPERAASLSERVGGNLSVLQADVLSVPPEDIVAVGGGSLPYVVVGNLPYFIGSAIVRHFLTAQAPPRWMVVTLQSEVAQSMAAPPGDMSYLSVEVQYYARPRLLFEIPPRAFRPPPKVRSAVLRLEVRGGPAVEVHDREEFFRLVRAGFAAPRKQLRNSLAVGLGCPPTDSEAVLTAAVVDATRRAQTLTLDEWADVYRAYRAATVAATP